MNKEDLNKSGIYQIVNLTNNKKYIGSAVNLRKRWKSHRSALRKNKHVNNHLQSTFNKFGFKNFVFEVLEFIDYSNNLIVREQYWIDFHKSYDNKFGYNISPKAGSRLGSKFSSESLQRLSDSHKGNKHTEETKKKISRSRYKSVYQFDLSGKLINKFKSLKEAEQKTGISRQLISGCCRNITNKAKNYFWSLNNIPKIRKDNKLKKIRHSVTKQTWESIKDACDQLNLTRSQMEYRIKKGEYEL